MKTKQAMGKFPNSIYAVNESLLDSVENDEVLDDEDASIGAPVEYRFMFHFKSGMGASVVKSMFFDTCMEPALCRLKNMGLADSWKFIRKLGKPDDFPNLDFYSKDMYGSAKRKFKDSSVLSVDVSIPKDSETADGLVTIAAHMMRSVMACGICAEGGVRMAFWKIGDDNVCCVFCDDGAKWVFHCGRKGYNLEKGCVKFAGSFIRTAGKLGFMKPVNDAGSRYVAYGFSRMASQQRMYMFDSSGGLLFEHEAGITDSKFGRFDENGLMTVSMYMNFNREMNFLKMDGTFLLDYMFDECEDSFSEGFISIRIKNKSGTTSAKLIDKDGNSLLGDWILGAENFVDGLSVITRYDDERKICNSNIIDRSGKLILDDWYEYVAFDDSANRKRAVNPNRKRDVAKVGRYDSLSNCWEYNYVDRSGKMLFKEWFNGGCGCMANGFASVCRNEDGTKTYNYIREDGSFVSEEWFDDVCGWPECGVFAFVRGCDEWRFMETETGRTVLDGYKFGKLDVIEADDGAKMYHVDHIYSKENGTWTFLGYQDGYSLKTFRNMVSADGKACCGMDDAARIQYVGNGFASVQQRSGDTVLWKWGAGPVDLGMQVSFINRFDEYGYARVVSSGDMKENIIDRDGNLVSDIWFENISTYMRGGFVAVKNDNVSDVLVCKTGKRVFGTTGSGLAGSGLNLIRLYEAVPDELVVVECADEKGDKKYNLFDADGKQLLDKWTAFRIELDRSGLLKVGPCSYVDRSGKIAGLI